MLAELRESDAAGEIAGIYEQIRRLWGVPYVSSLQRHLATRPGWLEWTWAALGPAFTSGVAQAAAWRAADGLAVPRLAPLSRDALTVWGVDAAGEAAIRATCASFVRVSPVNLVLSGLLRRLLTGERPPSANGSAPAWTPPAPIGPLPALADPAALPPAQRAVLATLGTTVAGQVFVPGLYRMLATWPAFLAHVATVLRPHLDDAATRAAAGRGGRRDSPRVLHPAGAADPARDAGRPRVRRSPGRARHVSQDQSRDGRLRPHARRRAAPPLTHERTIP